MSSIVTRLRNTGMYEAPELVCLCREAADEIELLRATLRATQELIDVEHRADDALARNHANFAPAQEADDA
jgi:hypothetical protein